MATPRMDITSFVGKLLEQDDVDALREGVRVLAQAVMGRRSPPRSVPDPTSGAPSESPIAMGTAPAGGTPGSARSS